MSVLTGCVLALLAVACAAGPVPLVPGTIEAEQLREVRTPIPILRTLNEYQPDGSYQYGYETANGISAEAKVYMRSDGPEVEPIQVIEGSYSYIGADGKNYRVLYIADDQGYRILGNYVEANSEPSLQQQSALARQQAALINRPQADEPLSEETAAPASS